MFTFSPLPHEEAARRIAELPLVSREVMDEMLPELKAYAFTITGLDVGDQMAKVRDTLAAVPKGEKNWDKARAEIAAELVDDLGGKASERRAELLLRTHVFRGYAASRYRRLMQQVDVFPFWQYKTHGDGRVRPSHAALNGKIFPAGHQIWQRIFPPWDWGCRCIVVPLTRAAVDRILARQRPVVPGQADKRIITPDEAQDILLPTQIAVAEVYDEAMANMILRAGRLPNGVPLEPAPTWAAAPWSIPGNIRHDWPLIKARYEDQPEVLEAFKKWADQTEISKGVTVSAWIGEGAKVLKTKAAKKAKAIKKQAKAAARDLATMHAALAGLKDAREAAVARLSKASTTFNASRYGSPAFDAAKLEMEAARAELEAVIERGRAVIEIPAAERGKLALQMTGVTPANITQGSAIVERFTHADLLPKGIKVEIISGRANANAGVIRVRANQTASVIAHEITHATEMQDAATLQASRDFLRSRRRPKEKPKKLSTIHPGHGYESWEIAIEDHWMDRAGHAYAGKLYFTGVGSAQIRKAWLEVMRDDEPKAFSLCFATELLSMGIERLQHDPVDFAAQDRDYFDFVVRTLQKLPSP